MPPRTKGDYAVGMLFMIVGALLIAAGVGIGLLQCYWYLQSGEWTGLSIIDTAQQILEYKQKNMWFFSPTEWVGIWKILNQVPLGLAVFLAGLFAFNIGASA